MSNFVQNNTRVIGKHLTTTANTTIFTAQGYSQAIGVRLANLSGNDETATVGYYSAADADEYRLVYQHIIPANGAVWLALDAFGLKTDDEIRVQASAANVIDVVMSVSEVPGRSG